MSAISRFWMCWGWGFIIFDERNLFHSHRYNFGTCGNRISFRFWFAYIPSEGMCFALRKYRNLVLRRGSFLGKYPKSAPRSESPLHFEIRNM